MQKRQVRQKTIPAESNPYAIIFVYSDSRKFNKGTFFKTKLFPVAIRFLEDREWFLK